MGLRDLSEAIILQSAVDLLDGPHEEEAIEFFGGEGFRMCAEMAKMSHDEKITFLELLAECVSACRKKKEDRPATQHRTVKRWVEPHRKKNRELAKAC